MTFAEADMVARTNGKLQNWLSLSVKAVISEAEECHALKAVSRGLQALDIRHIHCQDT